MQLLRFVSARGTWRSSLPSRTLQPRTRGIHKPAPLHFDVEKGVGDFLTPEGCKMVAIDFHNGLLDRVNELSQGTLFENMSLVDVVCSSSAEREHAQLFKYASQALNNGFFLDNIRPPPFEPTPSLSQSTKRLTTQIVTDFATKQHLQSSMSAAAEGMSSSGWIWLVTDQTGQLGVVATYGAGTLLVRSRQQRIPLIRGEVLDQPRNPSPQDSFNLSTPSAPTSGIFYKPPPPLSPRSQSRSIHVTLPQAGLYDRTSSGLISGFIAHDDKRGDFLNPLLCISVHEHAWIGSGYGVWGKKEYLRQFWTVVDWERVALHYNHWFSIHKFKTPAEY